MIFEEARSLPMKSPTVHLDSHDKIVAKSAVGNGRRAMESQQYKVLAAFQLLNQLILA